MNLSKVLLEGRRDEFLSRYKGKFSDLRILRRYSYYLEN